MRVLVTGTEGYIGCRLVANLMARGHSVVGFDTGFYRDGWLYTEPLTPRAPLLTVVRDLRLLEPGDLAGIEAVIHLAELSNDPLGENNPDVTYEINHRGSLRLAEMAKAAGVRSFVYVSTSEVYGTIDPVPPMTETHHTHPMTVYGASKLAGECYVRAYHRTYGYETVVVRPFNAYGPRSHHEGDSGEVIPKFMLRGMAGRPLIIFAW